MAEQHGFKSAFGIGTFLTSTCNTYFLLRSTFTRDPATAIQCRTGGHLAHIGELDDFTATTTGAKSVPLNIVIKLSSAGGRPAVKLSDNVGKTTGDSVTVEAVKRELGCVNRPWAEGDETSRW